MEDGRPGLDLEDPNLEEKLVQELKAQGVFDQFRKDCLSDVDTKVGPDLTRPQTSNPVTLVPGRQVSVVEAVRPYWT